MNVNWSSDGGPGSATSRSILSSRRSWLFARRKKSVRFSVDEGRGHGASGKNNKIEEKWRKYVEQQFKTLKKHKRNRWLGRGKKRKGKAGSSSSTSENTSENGAGPSFDSSNDVVPSFEFPPPDHKKRKKPKRPSSSKSKRRQTNTKTANASKTKATRINKKKTKKKMTLVGQPNLATISRQQQQQQQEEEENCPSYLKRPLNAFMLFSKACRQEFRNLLVPAFDSKVVAMVLGHIWRYLSKDERMTFYHEAEKSRQLFLEQKLKRKQISDAHEAQNRDDEGEGVEEMVKKPLNGFMLFCKEQRAHMDPQVTGYGAGRRLVRQMARKWNRMKPREKLVYITRADEQRLMYLQMKSQRSGQDNGTPSCPGNCNDEGEGDGTLDKAGLNPESANPGKNNNMWFPDSSDTDGSQPNSSTQVEACTVRAARQPPPPCSNGRHSTNPQVFCTSAEAGTEPCGSGDETDISEDVEDPSRKAAAQDVTEPQPCPGTKSSPAQEGKGKRGRTRQRRKKKSRVRRVKRRVYWKDEVQPWDVFNPVSSALCDEDICTRLYAMPMSRDDSWLHAGGAAGWYQGASSGCFHHPGLPARPCVSCLSLSSLKQQVEMAFHKPELELATLSSSLSSLCDLCPRAFLSDTVSMSSDDSCLHGLLNECHLSEHRVANSSHRLKSDLSGGPLSCPRGYNNQCCTSSSSCDDAQTKTPGWAPPSQVCAEALRSNATRGSNPQIAVAHMMKVPNSSSVKAKPCSGSVQPLHEIQREDDRCSAYSGKGKHLRGDGHNSEVSAEKTCLTYRTYLSTAHLPQNKQIREPEAEASYSSKCLRCNEINELICTAIDGKDDEHKPNSSLDSKAESRPTLVEISHDTASCKLVEEETQWSKESDKNDDLSSKTTTRPSADSGKDSKDMAGGMQNCTSAEPESESVPNSESDLPMDISPPAEYINYRDQPQTISSRSEATLVSGDEIHDNFGEEQVTEDPTSVRKLSKLTVCTSIQAQMKKSESMIWHHSEYLKRKLSFNSLEAMNSSKTFSVSGQSVYSVPKCPFAVENTHRSKASDPGQAVAESPRPTPVALNPPSYNSVMVHDLLPEDLELEYCQKKSWI